MTQAKDHIFISNLLGDNTIVVVVPCAQEFNSWLFHACANDAMEMSISDVLDEIRNSLNEYR